MSVAIVTGASSGLGREFALQLDGEPGVEEIWVLARRQGRLEEVVDSFEETRGRVFCCDLTDREMLGEFIETLQSESPRLSWVINNAGFGHAGRFESASTETNLDMIDLNIRALTQITRECIPHCREGSRIIQVASLAGFYPISGMALYAATKAYVLSLTDALAAEFADRDICFTSLCPGPVETEFQERAGEKSRKMQTVLDETPEEVVETAIADAKRKSRRSIPGLPAKVMAFLSIFIPAGLATWTTKIYFGLDSRALEADPDSRDQRQLEENEPQKS